MSAAPSRPRAFPLAAVLVLLLVGAVAAWWITQRDRMGVVYFFAYEADTFALVPASRPLPDPHVDAEAFARAAVDALRRGPGARERAAGAGSAVPDGTIVRGATLAAGRIDVDLSDAFTLGGGTASMRGRLEQVRWTLSEPDVVQEVRLRVEGADLEMLGGEGLLVESTWIRDAHAMPRW